MHIQAILERQTIQVSLTYLDGQKNVNMVPSIGLTYTLIVLLKLIIKLCGSVHL